MARSQEVQFLRARASRLREIAGTARTALSDPLRMMVNELEARADELERAYKPGDNSGQDRARGVRAAERLGRGLEHGTDPTTDPAAADVLAAYEVAQEARKSTADCYHAGVGAWRRVHPDQTPKYAAQQAVAVILAVKALLRIPDE